MVLLAGIALAAGTLVASQKFGTWRILPVVALVSVVALGLFDYFLGVAPLAGLAAGYQLERRQSYGWVIAGAAVPGGLMALQLMAILPEEIPDELLQAELLSQQQNMESLGFLVNEEIGTLQERMARAGYPFLPGAVFFFVLLQAALAYRLGHTVSAVAKVHVPPPLAVRLWRPWSQLIWVLVGGLALSLIGEGWVGNLGLNLILVMGVLDTFQGVAVGRYFAHQLGLAWMLEVAFYAVLTLSGIGFLLLPLAGLLDTWFDWRRLEAVDDEGGTSDLTNDSKREN